MNSKMWWASKTMWLNIVGGAVVLLQYFGTINLIKPEELTMVLAVANMVLRMLGNPKEIERKLM